MDAGAITSLIIIAVCFAGLHSIVDLRRQQARQLGVPYMDSPRRFVLAVVAGAAAIYFGGAAIVVLLDL